MKEKKNYTETSENTGEVRVYSMKQFRMMLLLVNRNVINQLMASNFFLFIRKNGKYIGITEENFRKFHDLVKNKTEGTRSLVTANVAGTLNQRSAVARLKEKMQKK